MLIGSLSRIVVVSILWFVSIAVYTLLFVFDNVNISHINRLVKAEKKLPI